MRHAFLFFSFAVLILGGAPTAALADQHGPVGEVSAPIKDYALSPGDKIKITVFNVPEITGEYVVSPSGELGLPLLGAVKAAGLTLDRLTDLLTGKLAKGYVNNPKVTVDVTNFRPFYVLGEVNHPGEFPFKATMTVEQAIATAGGYTYRAAHRKAYLRRAGGAERLVKFGDQPVYILPGDTIRIGERYL